MSEQVGRHVLLHAHEALDLCARAMDDEAMTRADPAQREDVRTVFHVAGQLQAACEIARMRVQAEDRLPVPRWLVTRYSTANEREQP